MQEPADWQRGWPLAAALDPRIHLEHRVGCALGQGFHFARPLDPRDFEALLESGARQVIGRL